MREETRDENDIVQRFVGGLLLAGCSGKELPVAGCEETVSDAVVRLCDRGSVAGGGVLVGFVRDGEERVFLLTARHVATYSNLIDRVLELRIGRLTCVVATNRQRWMCARKNCDAAWMELTEDEKTAWREKGALKYIPLAIPDTGPTEAMLPNTGTLDYAGLVAKEPGAKPEVHMFYKASIEVANMPIGWRSGTGSSTSGGTGACGLCGTMRRAIGFASRLRTARRARHSRSGSMSGRMAL